MEFDEIIGIDKDRILIELEVSSICNLRCPYCNPNSHDGLKPWPNSKILKDVIKNIYNKYKKPIILICLGGEPSLWPDAKNVLSYIKSLDKKNHIRLVSNGIRKYNWWYKHEDCIDSVFFSYHNSGAKIEKWIDNINKINTPYFIFTLGDANTWDDVLYNYNYIKDNSSCAGVMLKPIVDRGAKTVNYTKEQQSFIENSFNIKNKKVFDKTWETRGKLMFQGKYVEEADFSKIMFAKKNNFKGWKCNTGVRRFTLKNTGEIHGASGCKARGNIGNWHTGKLNDLYTTPIICPFDICKCSIDVGISKQK